MHLTLSEIINEYKKFEQVKAIAIGGSSAANTEDNSSDIDLYVFVENDIPINERENLVKKYSSKYEVGGEYFGSGDEFYVDAMQKQLDVMYWNKNWFEEVINKVWEEHYPSNGYTTCFLYTLSVFNILYDPHGWLKNLQDKIQKPYPEQLQKNIIKRNLMLLKDKPFASYYEQIENREDLVSINHRISAFLASYFDIIFAKNKLLHPGEKRLIQYAKNNCKILPENFEENIAKLLKQPNKETISILDDMVSNLKQIL